MRSNSAVTLAAILAPGNDVGRWKVKYGDKIVGYVQDVKRGGIESMNCHAGAYETGTRSSSWS